MPGEVAGAFHLRIVTDLLERVRLTVARAFGLDANVVIRTKQLRAIDRGCSSDLRFQGPRLHGTINLLEVGDTGALLAVFSSLDEVRDSDRSQQANDGHHDHNFNQREPGLPGHVNFHFLIFLFRGRERWWRAVNTSTFCTTFTDCPTPTALLFQQRRCHSDATLFQE